MRITKISVKKLFGVFDHEIPLNQESRITILHGPNGVGKTVLLRMVHGLFNSDFSMFFEVPYETFIIEAEDGTAVEVTAKVARARDLGSATSINITRGYNSNRFQRAEINERDYEWFSEVISDFSVRLIGTQRLWSLDHPVRSADSNHVREKYERMVPAVSTLSESLAKRVSGEMGKFDASDSKVKTAQEKVNVLRSLEENDSYSTAESETIREEILDLLTSAMHESKVGSDSSFERNQLAITYRQIISSLIAFKRLDFRENGEIVVISTDGKSIPLTMLSSGEQHQLVLFYSLLFRVPRSSLVLIDEPEISLHVTWQRRFLDDLQEVVRLRDIDVLVATHSPQIVNSRRDLMVGLGNTEHDR